ncbi:MAG TPA: hypothetical protein VGR71_16125 [Nitrospira sp.]|nr:hypothetical protein [Nitrospira sp.]
MNPRDEVPCQDSPHELDVLPRDGISPVAVAGWAVARVIAEAGEWRKAKREAKRRAKLRNERLRCLALLLCLLGFRSPARGRCFPNGNQAGASRDVNAITGFKANATEHAPGNDNLSCWFYGHCLSEQLEAPEVIFRPAGFLLNHALQGFSPEGAAPAVKDDSDPSTVGMAIDLVRPVATIIAKPVTDEG